MTNQLTVSDFLKTTLEVYNENTEQFLLAQQDPNLVNYLVGKFMVKTKGKADPKTTMDIIKVIVNSDLPNMREMEV